MLFSFFLSRWLIGRAWSFFSVLPRPQGCYGSVPGSGLWHWEPEFSSPPFGSWLSNWHSGSCLSWHCEFFCCPLHLVKRFSVMLEEGVVMWSKLCCRKTSSSVPSCLHLYQTLLWLLKNPLTCIIFQQPTYFFNI